MPTFFIEYVLIGTIFVNGQEKAYVESYPTQKSCLMHLEKLPSNSILDCIKIKRVDWKKYREAKLAKQKTAS